MAEADSGQSPAAPDDFTATINRVQDTAKWLIGIFGGIAAILVAGTQVSKLGQLPTDSRLLVAVLAGVLALLGIAIVIAAATRVLVLPTVSLDSLIVLEGKNPRPDDISFIDEAGLKAGAASISALNDGFDRAARNVTAAVNAGNAAQAAALSKQVDYYNAVIRQLLLGVKAHRALRLFWQTVWAVFIAGGVAAVGIALFAWAANPPTTTLGVVGTPSEAVLALTPAGQTALAGKLGSGCGASSLLVEVLGASKGAFDLETVATPSCAAARLTLSDPALGTLLPAAPQAIGVSSTPSATPVASPSR